MAVTAIPSAHRTATTRISGATLATFLISVITLAAFGPYVAGPVRTEQLAVYGIAALVLPVTFFRFRPGVGVWLFVAWMLLVFVALVGVVFPYRGPQPWEPGTTLAGIDNFVLPLVLMLLVWSIVSAEAALRVHDAVARIVVWLTAVNGAVAVVSTRITLDPYLQPFWASSDAETVAERAGQLGRLSGIFNQPAEAGVMYGVAGLLAVYLYVNRLPRLIVVLAGIIIGGFLCVSKIFLFGGLPLILLSLVRAGGGVRPLRVVVMLSSAAAILESGLLSQWTGSNYLLRRLIPDNNANLIQFYSAGRWDETSNLRAVISQALDISPLVGVGAGGWDVAYDSAWTEVVVVAGMVGALCYAITLVFLGAIALRVREPRLRLLMLLLATLIVGASLGISPLTANRIATVNWVLIALLILACNGERQRYRHDHAA